MTRLRAAAWMSLLLLPLGAGAEPTHRLELDRSAIRGNQELPRVMVILPWKDAGVAELAGRPFNSLIEEVLSPVDRDEFRRELSYFEQLQASGPRAGSSANSEEVSGP